MVGLTHVAFREVLREYLPKEAFTLWPTEMLSSKKIPHEKFGHTPESLRTPGEDGLVPQLLGNDEASIAKSLKILEAWGADAVDINMGCSVQKALKHNYGVSLMGDPNYAAQVVLMVKHNTKLPVSVKLRAGMQNDFEYLVGFVKKIQEAGASWVTLHPRTAGQLRRGKADWDQIKNLKNHIKIPLIGNGDVQTLEDVLNMLNYTKCDMVMVGRALTARPWLFWQLGDRLGFSPPEKYKHEKCPQTPEEEGAEYGRFLFQFSKACEKYFPQELGLKKLRFMVKTGSVWLPFGHHLYASLTNAKNFSQVEEMLRDFFSGEIVMSSRTELRQ